MIQAAFFDIDGTLLSFETHAIPDSAVQAIRDLRRRGIRTFLATGRNGDSTRFLMETGLFDGEILINGQLCMLGENCVYENPIASGDIDAAVSLAESGQLTLGFLSGHESFISRRDDFVEKACSYAGMAVPRIAPAALARNLPIHQIHCYGAPGTEDVLLERASGLSAVRWSPNFADVFPADGGKDRGIAALCRALGVSREETMAFGDGENDISMLEYAGIGVAMGNAGPAVQARADFVTHSVDAHGIAYAIEHFEDQLRPYSV